MLLRAGHRGEQCSHGWASGGRRYNLVVQLFASLIAGANARTREWGRAAGAASHAEGAAAAPDLVMCKAAGHAAENGQVPLLRWLLPLLCGRLGGQTEEARKRKTISHVADYIAHGASELRATLTAVLQLAAVGRVSYTDAVWVREQLAAAAAAAAGPGEVVGALAEGGWSTSDIVAAVVGVSAVAVQVEAEGGSGAGAGAGAGGEEAAAAAGGRLRLEVTWRPEHRQAGAVAAGVSAAAAAPPPASGSGNRVEQGADSGSGAAMQAAREGHVGSLEAMRAAGQLQGVALGGVAVEGAKGGHVGVVEWAWRAQAEGMLCDDARAGAGGGDEVGVGEASGNGAGGAEGGRGDRRRKALLGRGGQAGPDGGGDGGGGGLG